MGFSLGLGLTQVGLINPVEACKSTDEIYILMAWHRTGAL